MVLVMVAATGGLSTVRARPVRLGPAQVMLAQRGEVKIADVRRVAPLLAELSKGRTPRRDRDSEVELPPALQSCVVPWSRTAPAVKADILAHASEGRMRTCPPQLRWRVAEGVRRDVPLARDVQAMRSTIRGAEHAAALGDVVDDERLLYWRHDAPPPDLLVTFACGKDSALHGNIGRWCASGELSEACLLAAQDAVLGSGQRLSTGSATLSPRCVAQWSESSGYGTAVMFCALAKVRRGVGVDGADGRHTSPRRAPSSVATLCSPTSPRCAEAQAAGPTSAFARWWWSTRARGTATL